MHGNRFELKRMRVLDLTTSLNFTANVNAWLDHGNHDARCHWPIFLRVVVRASNSFDYRLPTIVPTLRRPLGMAPP